MFALSCSRSRHPARSALAGLLLSSLPTLLWADVLQVSNTEATESEAGERIESSTDDISATLKLKSGATPDHTWFVRFNEFDKPANIHLTFEPDGSDIRYSGQWSFPYQQAAAGANVYGTMDKKHKNPAEYGAPGPALNATITAPTTVNLELPDNPVILVSPQFNYQLTSRGASGQSYYNDLVAGSGARGGDVHVSLDTGGTLALTGATRPAGDKLPQSAWSLPWETSAGILQAQSVGGYGIEVQGNCGTSNCLIGFGDAGDGGDVSLTVASGQTLQLGTPKAPFTAHAFSPVSAVLAVSRGGMPVFHTDTGGIPWGANGKGGKVDVTFSGAIAGAADTVDYAMGVVAASVGGATQSDDKKHIPAVPSGGAGDVSVKLAGGEITLTSNNAIGVVATSTGGAINNPKGEFDSHDINYASNFGNVQVSTDAASSIEVGNAKGTHRKATDTTIGIAASSAAGWGAQPFVGTAPSSLSSPGNAGKVSIHHAGSVKAYGTGAIGILGQSVGGDGVSLSGGAQAFVGTKGGNGGTANDVSFVNDGGSIVVEGDGAKGVLLQSIAGGGGNGGNAAGLFVAVGGEGGHGGTAGKVTFSQGGKASVTTKGDHAQGVVLQSIGGGGGNGGYAKAYTALQPEAVGIGARGGIGGTGKNIVLGGDDASRAGDAATITTEGQHAQGLIAHTVGGGGGTGGAATSYNANDGLAVSVAVGGAGGGAGDGGNIVGGGSNGRASSIGHVTTTGHDAHGLLLQSIGGGGGMGGGATSAALSALGLPEVPNIDVSVGVGGKGGAGGAGGSINFDLLHDVTTSGSGAHGVVVHSVGGGGGAGGDATAGTGSLLSKSAFEVKAGVAVGGEGGRGGATGGKIDLGIQGNQTTQGHHAVGILAQSVGGGGGTGGIGNAASVTVLPLEEKTAQVNVGVGGSGGTGAKGGDVAIHTSGKSSINVGGSGSSGILAQSVGGGGGTAGNSGTQGVGGKYTIDVAVGGSGGSGNDAGKVNVDYIGNITTGRLLQLPFTDTQGHKRWSTPIAVGGSAHGIAAQSIGGGGGVGGQADPSAAILPDLTEAWIEVANDTLDSKSFIMWVARKASHAAENEYEMPTAYTGKVAVGGSGGMAGDGNAVNVTVGPQSGIVTVGHRSYGILAQSAGGGGGIGGASTSDSLLDLDDQISPATGNDFDIGVNVGGSGGASGHGGDVQVLVNNPWKSGGQNVLATAGYGSHVIMAQSIGGGGGIGHEGSIFGVTGGVLGASTPEGKLGSHSSGNVSSGNGGKVTVGTDDKPLVGRLLSVGDDAGVVFAQSLGGGGGLLSFGCTNSGNASASLAPSACHTNADVTDDDSVGNHVPDAFVNSVQGFDLLTIPNNTASDGSTVSVAVGQGAVLETAGHRSPVIVAQSLGGGGGYATAHRGNVNDAKVDLSALKTDENWGSGVGGDVKVALDQAQVLAAGDGSWGILAQSVSVGGGVLGDLATDLVAVPTAVNAATDASSLRKAGNIAIHVGEKSQVLVGQATGKNPAVNAHGIVAQTVGSGGGILGGREQKADATLNLTALDTFDAHGGRIDIDTAAGSSVRTDAIGGIAILAQSAGTKVNSDTDNSITVNIAGEVIGGVSAVNPASKRQLDGVGVMLSGGGNATTRAHNTLAIAKGGSLSTVGGTDSGYAIRADHGITDVSNHGTITGSVDLGSTPGTFTNESDGVIHKGSVFHVGSSSLENHGTLHVGLGDTVGVTQFTGTFNQHEGGRTVFTVDALADDGTHDRLLVDGVANVAGRVEVQADTLLPGRYEVLQADALHSTASTDTSGVFEWQAQATGQTLTLEPKSRLRSMSEGLGDNATSLAGYLERGWEQGDPGKARLFAWLNNEARSSQALQRGLQQTGGQQLHAQPQQMMMQSGAVLDATMGCPQVADAGVAADADGCVWAQVTGTHADQSAGNHNLGHEANSAGLRVGVARQLNDDWRVSAALGAGGNRLSSDGFSSKGQRFEGSVALTRKFGRASLTGAVMAAHGSFRNERTPQLGAAGQALGLDSTYESRTRTTLLGGRLRAAYTFGDEQGYVKPYVDLDVVHEHTPEVVESSAGPLAVESGPVSRIRTRISPMVEAGTSFDLDEGDTRVRAYVRAGASILPNNDRQSENRFVGALGQAGSFESRSDGPSAVGRLDVGVQVFQRNGLELSAEANLQAGGGYRSQGVSARLNYRF